jgi:hypothetical protein
MGAVYEAEDTASGRRVALKLISPEHADSAEAVERFRREGRLASTLSHPRCVFVLTADEEAGRPYIVMELMPGRTLADVVAEQGPMEPAEAVARTLDVIEGLQEAHRLGFIHRDVKPSNCFLDADGRVKVGDFGLAKSLAPINSLTRTGSFLGTVLFAAPEQIKGEPVDAQTDLYAAAATLYYLLTGQAPFDGGDAAATLARTVSDPAPSMRRLRPGLDPTLDTVVLRGLERDRGRRWRSLAEFRAALLPFRRGSQPFATLGMRFAAYFIDAFFLALIGTFPMMLLGWTGSLVMPAGFQSINQSEPAYLVGEVLHFLYFAVLEGLWGASLGKRLLGLRVRQASSPGSRPGLTRVLLRTAVFDGLLNMGVLVFVVLIFLYMTTNADEVQWARQAPWTYLLISTTPLMGMMIGVALLLAPMRARNGYRGLHEWLSGTRVVSLSRPEKRLGLLGRSREWSVVQTEGLPETLGPFAIHGALRWDERAKVLLGQDRGLGRSVWLWLRPREDAELPALRREISRPTRLRWLSCGRHADWQWDAFMAFTGDPLPALVRGRGEHWPRVLPLLEELTDELAAARAEGTLPERLQPAQVWVGLDGQVQLLDLPLGETADSSQGVSGPHRALALLAEVAVLTLEGGPRPPDCGAPVRAPVPLHVRHSLNRLLGRAKPYQNVGEFQTDLKAAAERPAEVGRSRRATHLAVLTALLLFGMCCCMLPAGWFSQVIPLATLGGSIYDKEKRLRELEEIALLDAGVRAANPDPRVRLHGVVQLATDYRLRDRLRQKLEAEKRLYAARSESMGWLTRSQLEQMEEQIADRLDSRDKELARQLPGLFDFGHVRLRAAQAIDDRSVTRVEEEMSSFSLGALLIWPALWIVWAFLARGGLSYRLSGIALVRRDGRPASRLQCVWRAILVWAPVTGLLALSLLLETHYWSIWQVGQPPRWLLSLSSVIWYTAALLLASYVALALWRPARAPHDRLSGIYLVPR